VTARLDPIVGKTAAANHGKISPVGAGNLTVSAKSISVMAFLIIADAVAAMRLAWVDLAELSDHIAAKRLSLWRRVWKDSISRELDAAHKGGLQANLAARSVVF
jgi:hypothetical protein